jgi:hypothetical protein
MTTEMTAAKVAPPTVTTHDDFRVILRAESGREVQRLVGEIERHVNHGHIHSTFTTTVACKFCNEKWEADANGYPWCCNKAQAWADENGLTPEPEKPSIEAASRHVARVAVQYRESKATAHDLDVAIDALREVETAQRVASLT